MRSGAEIVMMVMIASLAESRTSVPVIPASTT
jgi:hypothetical protein